MKKLALKIIVFGILFSLSSAAILADESTGISVIPRPHRVEFGPGSFTVSGRMRIITDASCEPEAKLLGSRLKKFLGWEIAVQVGHENSGVENAVILSEHAGKSLAAEGYELDVSPSGIVIRAGDSAGIFYGTQTLLQLLPPQALGKKASPETKLVIPCLHIEDAPRFKWRGMMLDVSRHFFTKAEVEQLLDTMAMYKLNTFHWHLTDDQGWRIEIKKYPLLTSVGAWRKQIGFGLDPKASKAYSKDGRYGGFYTQDDIREVVAYAQARHITIVPEIEMPGHESAALMAHPQFSCTGGPFTADLPGGVFNGVFCAGNDAAFAFVQDVLAEVIGLFPSKYIHVGGDEVPGDNWKACAKCQARMKQEGLHEERELESYFIRRIEKFIDSRGRTLIGWSEIREGGLAQNAVVMDWAGGAVEAASAGHDVVMSPLADCYFDHYQSTNHATEPHAIGGYLPLEQVYAFNPMPAKLDTRFQAHILGGQANVWTEYMPSIRHVQYMVFPRLCALAEVTWSPRDLLDWQDFQRRLTSGYQRLDELGINYRREDASGKIQYSQKTAQ